MQLEALKVFCDVACHRSFSHAAELNDVTQSAVSQIVSQLEKRMKVQLIDRSTRPLQLTPPGMEYFEGCKTLLEQYDELEGRIRSDGAEISGSVLVAAIYSVSLSDMGQLVQRFQTEWPNATVHIDYTHPDRVYERVKDGTADLGLLSYPKKTPNVVAAPWREEMMVLVCSPKHPLASRLAVPMKELQEQVFVHFDKNLVIRRRVDKFLRSQGVEVEVAAEFDSIENIKHAVAVGAGVALLPEPTVRREVKARTLVALPLFDARFTRPLAILHRRDRRLSAAAKRFMELLLASDGATHQLNGKHVSNGKSSNSK
jgi:DNA-binding transcriptional LysR family regulator